MGRKAMFGKEKLTKEEKQLRKQYFKMIKKNQKELDSLNKAAHRAPWDWSFGLNYLIAYMEFMQDYYNLGWNVWQTDETLVPLKKSLDATLEAYKKWDELVLDCFDTEEIKIIERQYYDLCKKENKKSNINEKNQFIKEHMSPEDYPYNKENLEKYGKEYVKRRNKFFKLLSEHIEEWWD